MLVSEWPFITIDERGNAVIEGTGVKVIEVAADLLAYGWSAEEIARQRPHLTRPQIHAALGYYYEHKPECDRQLDEALHFAETVCRQAENPALLAKLRRRGDS